MNAVVHFEMPYEVRDRMVTFYETVFGWKMTKLGPDMMNYVVARTAEPSKEHDDQYKENARGTIGGGFYPKDPESPAQYPSVVIAVDDIRDTMERITKNGGKVLGEPMDIPGTGAYVSFIDTEGNRASILKPIPM
jgi:hypothetical protein